MAEVRGSAHPGLAFVIGYIAALFANVAVLLVYPFSTPLLLTLFALLGLFFVWAMLVFFNVRIARSHGFGRASDPGSLQLSVAKLRRIQPELFESDGNLLAWFKHMTGSHAAWLSRLAIHLGEGDSRAAVVLSRSPLLIAAYTDELDCIALLQFPDRLAKEYGLKPRSRLLTVNWYYRGGPLAADLEDGPLSHEHYSNFMPIIADFVTDDVDRLRDRKRTIAEEEWERAWALGHRYLVEHGFAARDGRPTMSRRPADLTS